MTPTTPPVACAPPPTAEDQERTLLAGELRALTAGAPALAGAAGRVYEVILMDPGPGNGWTWPAEVLERDAGVFEGCTSFLDHEQRSVQADRPGGRRTEDICGIVTDPQWDASLPGIRARWSPRRPKGEIAQAIVEDYLADRGSGRPTTNVGISVDVSFAHSGRTVTRLIKAHSADVVFDPARGGRFIRALLSKKEEPMPDETPSPNVLRVANPQGEAAAMALFQRQSLAVLDAALGASRLPAAAQNRIRQQFAGQPVLDVDALDRAIADERAYLASLNPSPITGSGAHEERDRLIRVGGTHIRTGPTSDPIDRIRLGLSRWFGADLPAGVDGASVPRVDLGELYAELSGDLNISGHWDIQEARQRTGLANLTDTTLNDVVADAINVVVFQQWDVVAAAGYNWWQRVVWEQDFDSLFEVDWTTVGGFGNLAKIAAGQAVPEISVDNLDAAEDTGNWEMAGGIISVPLQTFDKAAKRGVFRSLPKKLGVAAIRTLSADVANIFTAQSGTGPTIADNTALFTAGHGNLKASALTAAAWDEVVQDQWKQTEQNSDKLLAIRPAYLLVPIELESLALRILTSEGRQGISDNDVNPIPYRMNRDTVIPVPEFTDPNDWATVCDPRIYPAIGVGYRFGRRPTVVAEPGGESSNGRFTRNVLRWKVQWMYTVSVITHRGLQKRNVA